MKKIQKINFFSKNSNFPEIQRQKEAEAEERRLLEVEKEKIEAEERARKMSEMLKYQFERGAEECHRED